MSSVLYLDRHRIVIWDVENDNIQEAPRAGMLDDATNIIDDTQLRLLFSDLRKSSPHFGEVMVIGSSQVIGVQCP